MALSSTPADPPAAAATSATTPRLFAAAPPPSRDPRPPISPYPHPPSHYHHRLPSQQLHQQPLYASQPFANLAPRGGGGAPSSAAAANRGILYPVASSGRGFLPKAIRSQSAAAADQIANQAGFPPRPVLGGPPYSHTVRAFGFPHSDPHAHLIRPAHVHQTFLGSTGVISAAVKGVPVTGQLKVRNFILKIDWSVVPPSCLFVCVFFITLVGCCMICLWNFTLLVGSLLSRICIMCVRKREHELLESCLLKTFSKDWEADCRARIEEGRVLLEDDYVRPRFIPWCITEYTVNWNIYSCLFCRHLFGSAFLKIVFLTQMSFIF